MKNYMSDMFKTRGVDTTEKRGAGKYLGYGIQYLMINDIEIKTAQTGKKQCILHMESSPVSLKGFEADPSAKNGGQIGKVRFPKIYIDPQDLGTQYDEQTRKKKYLMPDLVHDVGIMCDKMGTRAQLDDAVENVSTFEEFIQAIKPVITGKYLWWKITGEKYLREGKEGVALSIPRWGFCATQEEGASHLKFDKESAYDLKPLEKPDTTAVDSKSDLPF